MRRLRVTPAVEPRALKSLAVVVMPDRQPRQVATSRRDADSTPLGVGAHLDVAGRQVAAPFGRKPYGAATAAHGNPGDRPPAVPAASRCRARQHHSQAVNVVAGGPIAWRNVTANSAGTPRTVRLAPSSVKGQARPEARPDRRAAKLHRRTSNVPRSAAVGRLSIAAKQPNESAIGVDRDHSPLPRLRPMQIPRRHSQ
jgi:hypothetical protein